MDGHCFCVVCGLDVLSMGQMVNFQILEMKLHGWIVKKQQSIVSIKPF